jgi:shikimate dehydrogenase
MSFWEEVWMGQSSSALLGLIGYGIQGSLTPAMHECEAEKQGIRAIYRLIDLQRLGLGADALPELLTAAERMGFTGLNITFPCKQEVIPLLDELSEDAAALGAVNTVLLRGDKRIGHNTDLFGFAENVRRGLPGVKRDRVVQLGAGGAGSAVAHALMSLGIRALTIFDTDTSRAERLAADLVARFGEGRAVAGSDLAPAMASAEGLVNTTPVGMAKFPGLPLRRSCCGRSFGWQRSFIFRSRRCCWRALAHLVAEHSTEAVWRCFRQPRRFGCSPGACRMRSECCATLPNCRLQPPNRQANRLR